MTDCMRRWIIPNTTHTTMNPNNNIQRRLQMGAISVVFSLASIAKISLCVGASPPGGILPPPPPPPPQHHATQQPLSIFDKLSKTDEDDNNIIIPKPSEVETSSSSSSEKLLGDEEEDGASRPTEKINDKDDDILLKPNAADTSSDDVSVNKSMWDIDNDSGEVSSQPVKSRGTAQENKNVSNQQYQWGQSSDEQQRQSQYSGQYYDQQQQWQQQQQQARQPQHQSWGQSSYQQQPNQQNQYYQQQQPYEYSYQSQYPASQQHQQQMTTYENQQQQTPGGGQLALYNPQQRNQHHPKKTSLFSLAVKKLQTGIDSVSDTVLDAKNVDKITASVSSLTSKIGSTIGGTVGANLSAAGGNGMQQAGQRRLMQANRRGPGTIGARSPPIQRQQQQQGQHNHPQQRMQQPNMMQYNPQKQPRLVVKKKEEVYAPPISELYSLGTQHESLEQDDGIVSDDDAQHHMDETTDDEEDETIMPFPGMMNPLQKQPMSKQSSNQIRSFPKNDGQSSQPRIHSIPPQPQRPVPSSQWPGSNVNGSGSYVSGSNANSRRKTSHDDDNDDDYYSSSSIGHKVKSALGSCIPRVPNLFKRSSMSSYDDGSWSDDELNDNKKSSTKIAHSSTPRGGGKSSIVPQPVQSLLEKREKLLSTTSLRKCTSIGRAQAILTAGQLALVVYILHEVVPLFFQSISSSTRTTLGGDIRGAIISTLLSTFDGWAPYALVVVFLLSISNEVWIKPVLKGVYDDAAFENIFDVAYTQLYLRLVSSLSISKSLSSDMMMNKLTRAQAVHIASLARLRSFVTIVVCYVLLSTVAVLRPASVAVFTSLVDMIRLDAWRVSPLDWHNIFEGTKIIGISLAKSLHTLFDTELDIIRQQPIRVAIVVSLLAALISVTYLPLLEEKGRKGGKGGSSERENGDEEENNDSITSLWSNIGASSASRLWILSSPRGVEGALSQFMKLRPDAAAAAGLSGSRKKRNRRHELHMTSSFQSLLKKMLYSGASSIVLMVPLTIYIYLFASTKTEDGSITLSAKVIPENGWLSLFELTALLVFTQLQTGTAVNDAIQANRIRLGHAVSPFFEKLVDTVNEVQKLAREASSGADFQAMLTANPVKGISVSDFWASHSSRRAWAVKGSNIQCRNGEVVLVVGDDGAGKSRLLTAIAEYIFNPPKQARTTTYVRGSISIAGVDLAKWDRKQLQQRVGVLLNDVRTECDYASLISGCTLEEVLEPVPIDGSHVGPKERNACSVAMKITGLENKLLSRLPSKLSSVISAKEDELKPSPLRAPAYPLSPSDWSKVILTKILAQLISGNENQLSSPGTIKKCLIGSVILLDDALSQMSEVDEAHVIASLRSTGAAVLLTSNRWATGRFVDRIVVIDGGSVIESGTHADLLNLGPERSLYARQWSAMT